MQTSAFPQARIQMLLPLFLRTRLQMHIYRLQCPKGLSFFNGKDPSLIAALTSRCDVQIFEPGEALCREGDAGNKVRVGAQRHSVNVRPSFALTLALYAAPLFATSQMFFLIDGVVKAMAPPDPSLVRPALSGGITIVDPADEPGAEESVDDGPARSPLLYRVFRTGDHFGHFAVVLGTRHTATLISVSRSIVWVLHKRMVEALIVENPSLAVEVHRALAEAMPMLSPLDNQGIGFVAAEVTATRRAELDAAAADAGAEESEGSAAMERREE